MKKIKTAIALILVMIMFLYTSINASANVKLDLPDEETMLSEYLLKKVLMSK